MPRLDKRGKKPRLFRKRVRVQYQIRGDCLSPQSTLFSRQTLFILSSNPISCLTYISSSIALYRKAILTSIYLILRLRAAAIANIILQLISLTTNIKVLLQLTPSYYLNPRITQRALYRSILLFSPLLSLQTHFPYRTRLFRGGSTRIYIILLSRDLYSSFIAANYYF